MPQKKPPKRSAIAIDSVGLEADQSRISLDRDDLRDFLKSHQINSNFIFKAKNKMSFGTKIFTNSGLKSIVNSTTTSNCYFLEVIEKVDEKKFQDFLKTGKLDFLYIMLEDKSPFEYFEPSNYQMVFDNQISSADIDLEYIEKKFSMFMDFYEYFFKYKTIFEAETANAKFNSELFEEEAIKFKEFHNLIVQRNQEAFEETLKLYTESLTENLQASIYYIENIKHSLIAHHEFSNDEIRLDPKNQIPDAKKEKLKEMQAIFKEKSKKMLESKSAILEEDKLLYGNIENDEFIKICKSRKDVNRDEIKSILGIDSDEEEKFAIIACSFDLCEKSNIYGHRLQSSFSPLSLKTSTNKSFNLGEYGAPSIMYGFSEFFKIIPKNQLQILKDFLLSEDKKNFITEDFTTQKNGFTKTINTPKNFDECIAENYFRLNVPPLIQENSSTINKKPHLDFPANFKKNLFNIVLFNRDIDLLENLPLDFMAYQGHASKSSDKQEDNGLELFFYGHNNNSVTQEQTANSVKKLLSYGFSSSKNLKLGSFDDLINKVDENFDHEIAKDLEKNLKIIKEFEENLSNYKSTDSESLSETDKNLMAIISDIASLFQNSKNPDLPIQKALKKKDLEAKNILNPTGFLNHLSNSGFISKLSSNKDKSSLSLMKKINDLIEKLNENNPILIEKKEREFEKNLAELFAPTVNPPKAPKHPKTKNKTKECTKKASDNDTEVVDEVGHESLETKPEAIVKKDPQDVLKEKIDEITKKTVSEAGKNFDKFTPFFDFLRKKSWIGASDFGLYGSKVYNEFIKQSNPNLSLNTSIVTDYDFFGVCEQIFSLTPDKRAAAKNFEDILEEFNKIDPNYQISFAEEKSENSVNYNSKRKSLNYKLKAKVNGEELDFDLNFYSRSTILENMQWQLNFERVSIVQKKDHQISLEINNSGCDELSSKSPDSFVSDSQTYENPNEFLFAINTSAKGFLSRLLNGKGIYKYLTDSDLDSIKKFLLEDEKSREKLIEEYQSYQKILSESEGAFVVSPKISEASSILQRIHQDPILNDLAKISQTAITPTNHQKIVKTDKSFQLQHQ